jgi:thiol:disulfide interchange protein DsbD
MKLLAKFLFFFLLFPIASFGQIEKPVTWKFLAEERNGETYIVAKATIQKGWHVYSQKVPNDGPLPTTFSLIKGKEFSPQGKVLESKPIEKMDNVFGAVIRYFEDKAEFYQKIKLNSDKDFVVKGSIEFMACNDNSCLPPDLIEFELNIKGKPLEKKKTDSLTTLVEKLDSLAAEVKDTLKDIASTGSASIGSTNNNESKESTSLLAIFLGGFIGGLLALMTPCVFPMIPLTVSFFTKRASSRGKGIASALFYSGSIISVYTGLGMLITVVFGADALNEMASNGIVNMLFFIVFVVFAISFLGAFEITLPNWLLNKADAESDKGGLGGIFFMAITLSLVSFSCTGPIIGNLLVEAAVNGNRLGPATGMFGFSLALALPFGLFAVFPSWLSSLPKSGGWLNTVKVSLGFLELALAMKFLSTVDLAYHWNLVTREIFLAFWIGIFTMWALYLIGVFRFSHDDESGHISIGRGLLAMVIFSFIIYLVPGMFGAPLKLISGFPPPSFYSEGWNAGGSAPASPQISSNAANSSSNKHCPHGLNCFHDYQEALAFAKKENKPLMVDFTGWSCVNCRKMEDQVWSDPQVLQRIANDYVLVSLYVDDKEPLPESEQYVSAKTGKKIKTVGNKWSDLEIERYDRNSQPYYVLLDHDEKPLTKARAYDTDIQAYIDFLDQGKAEFAKNNK